MRHPPHSPLEASFIPARTSCGIHAVDKIHWRDVVPRASINPRKVLHAPSFFPPS